MHEMFCILFQEEKPILVAPEFVIKIQDVSVRERETARFECKVKGEPAPSVVWYHDGTPLKSDDIYQIVPGPDGESALVLPEAYPEDAGTYSVMAKNDVGQVECQAVLTIIGKLHKDVIQTHNHW